MQSSAGTTVCSTTLFTVLSRSSGRFRVAMTNWTACALVAFHPPSRVPFATVAAVRRTRGNTPDLFTKRRRRFPARPSDRGAGGCAGGRVGGRADRDGYEESLVEPVAACEVPLPDPGAPAERLFPGRSGESSTSSNSRISSAPGTRPRIRTHRTCRWFSTGRVHPQGIVGEDAATVADLAPTFAELLDFDEFPERDGRVLEEALLPPDERNGVPKLIFTVVWDGGGDNCCGNGPTTGRTCTM